jgi:DNA-binding CsgD family transcriptional regulator
VTEASSKAERLDPKGVMREKDEGASDKVRLLVQQLLGELARRGPPVQGSAGEESVILDLEVDGVRCTLIRRPPSEAPHFEIILSPREREIARMVAKGYPNKVIARVLEISSWTVSTHLRRVFAKLGVSSRAAMVAHLLEEGQIGNAPRTGH